MILKKQINSNIEIYNIEINTNDEKENVVTLYTYNIRQPLMQIKYIKTEENDYIKITKDIVTKYENGDKSAYSDFNKWDGFV